MDWRWVPGYEGKYQVSDQGDVRRWWRYRKRWGPNLRTWPDKDGYRAVGLSTPGVRAPHQQRVHRLVAAAFLGPTPEGMFVCHNNGDPADNRLENLRIDSPKGNSRDQARHGTQNRLRGAQNGGTRFTEEDVLAIRKRRAEGETITSLAREYGVGISTISRIANRQRWAHLR